LAAQASGYTGLAQPLDEVVGRMTRRVWPLLDDEDAPRSLASPRRSV
jgi:hypothetical protein